MAITWGSGRDGLQRLFSAFPGGWSGVGLLLLRAAVGWTAIAEGVVHLLAGASAPDATVAGGAVAGGAAAAGAIAAGTVAAWATGLLGVASGVLLLMGLLTPVAGVVVALGCACHAFAWIPVPAPHVLGDGLATFLMIVVAAAVVLLGPGAWSLDAYLFGRREIVIPHESRPPRSG